MEKRNTMWDELDEALRTHEYTEAERLLDALSKPIPKLNATRLLNTALDCIPYIFEKVLSHCEHGEVLGARDFVIDTENGFMRGPLSLLAAAMGRCEHLRLLLDAGMDVNGVMDQPMQCLPLCREIELCVRVRPFDMTRAFEPSKYGELAGGKSGAYHFRWHLECCTPLAAAILCGRLECVELLLHRPGVDVAESEAVSSALLFYGRRSPQVIAAQRLVMSTLENRPVRFAGAIQQLSAKRLGQELRRARYDAAYLGEVVERVLPRYWDYFLPETIAHTALKLQMLFDHAPELLDDPMYRGRLLSFLPRLALTHPLFELYIAHCGETADVAQLVPSFRCSPQECWALLDALSERVECVLDRDADLMPLSQRGLRMLERYVRFLPPRFSGGLSCLTQSVLNTGSVRFTKWAAQKGWLCEPRRLMLQYLSERHIDSLRATILMLPEPEADETLAPADRDPLSARWFPDDCAMQAP